MNPNPEQPDVPFTIDGGGGLLFIRETKSFVCVASFCRDPKSRERALITLAALNAATALHAAGWDAARVFERLPELLNGSRELVRGIEGTGLADQFAPSNTPKNQFIALLAQLKLKRDTAGGGR